ncbi:MAG: hypothetical protein JNK48_18070 [Bryobacterales bacterium]|nr:hypothetical protein [Bryobacterales bacterium]
MAFKILNYNVEGRVGQNSTNVDTDVLLVRFLLKRLSQTSRFASTYGNLPLTPTFDNQLKEAILWFQKLVRQAGRPITVDGIVSPAPRGDGDYTINYLYRNYSKYYPQFRGDLDLDPNCPSALKSVSRCSGYASDGSVVPA